MLLFLGVWIIIDQAGSKKKEGEGVKSHAWTVDKKGRQEMPARLERF